MSQDYLSTVVFTVLMKRAKKVQKINPQCKQVTNVLFRTWTSVSPQRASRHSQKHTSKCGILERVLVQQNFQNKHC